MFDLDPFITIWTSNLDHELKYPLKTIKVEPTNSNEWFSGIVYGPLQAHVYRQDKSKGVMENPLYKPKISIISYLGNFYG